MNGKRRASEGRRLSFQEGVVVADPFEVGLVHPPEVLCEPSRTSQSAAGSGGDFLGSAGFQSGRFVAVWGGLNKNYDGCENEKEWRDDVRRGDQSEHRIWKSFFSLDGNIIPTPA